jgi:predicted ATPase
MKEITLSKLTVICGQTKSEILDYQDDILAKIYRSADYKKEGIFLTNFPEMGLHPQEQIQLARNFVRQINKGKKHVITTMSDFFIKELNNLLALSNDFADKKELMSELGYQENEILNPNDFSCYLIENGKTRKIALDKYGMVESAFDKAIIQINECSHRIASAVRDI